MAVVEPEARELSRLRQGVEDTEEPERCKNKKNAVLQEYDKSNIRKKALHPKSLNLAKIGSQSFTKSNFSQQQKFNLPKSNACFSFATKKSHMCLTGVSHL